MAPMRAAASQATTQSGPFGIRIAMRVPLPAPRGEQSARQARGRALGLGVGGAGRRARSACLLAVALRQAADAGTSGTRRRVVGERGVGLRASARAERAAPEGRCHRSPRPGKRGAGFEAGPGRSAPAHGRARELLANVETRPRRSWSLGVRLVTTRTSAYRRGAPRRSCARPCRADWEEISEHGPGSDAQADFSREFCAALAERGWLTQHWPAGLRRPRRPALAPRHRRRGDVGDRRAARRPVHERELDRPGHHALRQRGAEGRAPAAHRPGRRPLVSGLLRARGGLRPGGAAHPARSAPTATTTW